MAASDEFRSFLDMLSAKEREVLNEPIAAWSQDLLAARSEEARLRVVEGCIREARERLLALQR